MPATKTKYVRIADASTENEYRGKRTRTGNSYGFRFDRAFFKSHPEFAGEVKAHVIAPGRMLVSVAGPVTERRDPVMQSFLAFLANDIAKAPEKIKPMSPELARRIDRLVEEVSVSCNESLEEESLLGWRPMAGRSTCIRSSNSNWRK
jgi:antitoxin PrlF